MYVLKNKLTNKYLCVNKHSANVWSRDIEFATVFMTLQEANVTLNLYYGEPIEIIPI